MIKTIIDKLGARFKARAMPATYAGVRFASTLEADWAATFDSLAITWSYEPIALILSDGQPYRCDFFLPAQRIWCEVKGPHDLRIDKPRRLLRDLGGDPDDWRAPMVVVCHEPIGASANVERADGGPVGIDRCGRCVNFTFVDLDGAWQCRVCGFWEERTGGLNPVEFVRTYRSAEHRRRQPAA